MQPTRPSFFFRACAAFALGLLAAGPAAAQPLTWGLSGGNGSWPDWARTTITNSMNEAVAAYNQYGFFEKHVTANYNTGVPTAQANYDGWIEFGGQYNTRTAIHEIAHALGTGTYGALNGGPWATDSAAGRLEKLYDGQQAVLNTGGTHFWPYGLNYDNEDGPAARERHCKLVAAFRFDMGIVVDSDKDGLPDDWETHHFAGLGQDGEGDPDRDGIDNRSEYDSDSDPQQACPIRDGHTYVITSQITQLAISVAGASTAEAAATEQRPPDGKPWQQWTAHYLGGGFWRLDNVRSGKVLEVPGTDTKSALPIQQSSWSNTFHQQWRVVSGPGAKPGYFQIASRETGRVVDGLDGSEGAPIQQYPFLGNLPQQFWSFEDVGGKDDAGDAGAAAVGGGTSTPDGGAPSGHGDQSEDGMSADDNGDEADAAPIGPSDADDHGATSPQEASGCSLAMNGMSDRRPGGFVWLALLALLRRRRRV